MKALPWIIVVVLLLALASAGFGIYKQHAKLKEALSPKRYKNAYDKGKAEGAKDQFTVSDIIRKNKNVTT